MNFSEGGTHVLKKWLAFLGEPQKRGSDLACEEFTKLGRRGVYRNKLAGAPFTYYKECLAVQLPVGHAQTGTPAYKQLFYICADSEQDTIF